MKTEIRRKIDGGFKLTEAELTRIKDTQNEQMKKLSGHDAEFNFTVKYANGAVAEPLSVQQSLPKRIMDQPQLLGLISKR